MKFVENIPLAMHTTLGVGGAARWYARASSVAEIQECLRFVREQRVPLFVLGGGSNVLVPDEGFPGLVMQIALRGVGQFRDSLHAGAGESWDTFVERSVILGMAGVECLSGIPGTVGGTPVQNVGAYGQEVSQTIGEVEAIDVATRMPVVFRGSECGFGYRTSRFNGADKGKYIVTGICFRLKAGGAPCVEYPELQRALRAEAEGGRSPSLQRVREVVRELRRRKGMLLVAEDPECRSAGSFFKNPVVPAAVADRIEASIEAKPEQAVAEQPMPRFVTDDGRVKLSAAWLIEQAGFAKGYTLGNAGISSRHTLALVNRGGATAGELLALRDCIAAGVERRFGIKLQQEPVLMA